MGNYRKKPVEIDAIVFTRNNFNEIVSFTNGTAHTLRIERRPDGKCTCIIPTLEGEHIATEGDYIIRGVKGELYPCRPDIFDMTYEAVKGKQTNADRIRAMSDEELVKYFWDKFEDEKFCKGGCKDGDDCDQCRLAFLKQPAEG